MSREASVGIQLLPSGLQARLLVTTALVLSACLGSVAWILDRAFNATVLAGAEDELRAVAHGLQGTADERDGRLAFAAELSEPRLGKPDSGWYAYVDAGGEAIWRSPSIIASGSRLAEQPPIRRRPAPGESYFGVADAPTNGEPPRFVLAYTVVWEALGNTELTFWVLTDQLRYRRQISDFRRRVGIGLAVAATVFILIQLAALRWGLRPVRRMAERVRGLQAGANADIGDDYPHELSGLAYNLNRFIATEKANRDRYRRAMDDLAHSLKTPLAVLTNATSELDAPRRDLFREQLEHMKSTVTHQLSRTAAAQAVIATDSTLVSPVAKRIVRALQRAYAEKEVTVETKEIANAEPATKRTASRERGGSGDGAPRLAARVDERDLMEMLGNLIENAFKYTRTRVRIVVRATAHAVAIDIDDDGDGIAPDKRQLVLKRGARVDTATTGQGIGLAVVVELAAVYGGRLTINDSDLGGAALRLELPLATTPASR